MAVTGNQQYSGVNLFPPGLRVRSVGPTDNEAVRSLFLATQNGLLEPGADPETRIALKRYTDASVLSDMARASVYYKADGRRMWVLESQDGEIVAMAAVDSDEDDAYGGAQLRRLAVNSEFRRMGVATLLMGLAERWSAKVGFKKMHLYVAAVQPDALSLFSTLGYAQKSQSNVGPIAVFELEKSLDPTGNEAGGKG